MRRSESVEIYKTTASSIESTRSIQWKFNLGFWGFLALSTQFKFELGLSNYLFWVLAVTILIIHGVFTYLIQDSIDSNREKLCQITNKLNADTEENTNIEIDNKYSPSSRKFWWIILQVIITALFIAIFLARQNVNT